MSKLPQFDMSDEEVRLAREAARFAVRCLGGGKLAEGLRLGAALLVGRTAAMKSAGVNAPLGRAYAEAFYDWKRAFKFPEGKEAEALYDAAIVCAQNPELAGQIIAGLAPRQKAEMGIFGLAKRVRAKLNEFDGRPKKSHASRDAELEERVALVEARAAAQTPLAWWWEDSPEEVGRVMAHRNDEAFRRLAAAGLAALKEPLLLEDNPEPQ